MRISGTCPTNEALQRRYMPIAMIDKMKEVTKSDNTLASSASNIPRRDCCVATQIAENIVKHIHAGYRWSAVKLLLVLTCSEFVLEPSASPPCCSATLDGMVRESGIVN